MNGRAFCTSTSHNNLRLHVKLTGIRFDIWAVVFSSLIRLEYAEQVEIYSKALTIVKHGGKGFVKQNLFLLVSFIFATISWNQSQTSNYYRWKKFKYFQFNKKYTIGSSLTYLWLYLYSEVWIIKENGIKWRNRNMEWALYKSNVTFSSCVHWGLLCKHSYATLIRCHPSWTKNIDNTVFFRP